MSESFGLAQWYTTERTAGPLKVAGVVLVTNEMLTRNPAISNTYEQVLAVVEKARHDG